jgi:glutaredoxin-like protein
MAYLEGGTKEAVKKKLSELPGEVRMVFFKDALTCETCTDEEGLLREVSSLSDKVKLDVYNRLTEPDQALLYGVTASPTLVISGPAGSRVRFLGIPAGYEFVSLLESLKDGARGKSDLTLETREKLSNLSSDVHIQVFVTPTCPYCPQAVINAHKLAVEYPRVRADMVEATEFPELAERFGVSGVPKTIVNGSVEFVGAQPEEVLAEAVMQAVSSGNGGGK